MKKHLWLSFVFALLSSNVFATVPAEPYAFQIFQYDGLIDGAHYEYFTPDSTNGLFGYTGSDYVGHVIHIGSGLAWDGLTGDYLNLKVMDVPQASVTGLVTALSGKESSISGGTSGQYWGWDKAFHNWINADWNASSGSASILNKPTIPTNTNQLTNGAGYLTAEVDGSTTNEIELPSQTGNSGKVLSTNGTTPSWVAASSGSVTSVTAGTGLSGGTITTTGTISLPNTGTASTYDSVTTDAQGRVSAGTNRAQSSASRSLNTCFQVSSTRDSFVNYSVDIATTLSLTTGQTGTVFLEVYTNSGCTTGTQELARSVNGNTGTLAIGLNITQNVNSWG